MSRLQSLASPRMAVLVALVLSACLFGQTDTKEKATSWSLRRTTESAYPIISTPRWAGAILIQARDLESRAPQLHLLDSAGHSEIVSFSLPGSPLLQALKYSAGNDRSLILSGSATSDAQQAAAFIGLISPDRTRQMIKWTAPFVPEAVVIAADGTIWSVGTVCDDEKRITIADNVVQRYSASGILLSSTPIANLKVARETPGDATMGSTLLASRDRVGWFTRASQYIEFSLDGSELGRFDAPSDPDWDWHTIRLGGGLALSEDNHAVLCSNGKARHTLQVLTLDRPRRAWVPTSFGAGDTPQWQSLLGFDGNILVTRPKAGILLRWEMVQPQ